MNRFVSRTTPDGATVSYGYDLASNLLTVTDSGGTVTYTYNAVNLPTQVREPGGATSTMTYSARYARTSLDYPNDVAVFYAYDTSDRLTGIDAENPSGTPLVSLSYSYRNPSTGNNDTHLRFSVTDNMTSRKTAYSYDVLNRLTKARTTEANGSMVVEYRYTLDGNGNRTKAETDFPGANPDFVDFFTYNGANQLTVHNNETFTYDGAGNLTASNLGAELTYNAAAQTTAIRPRADRGTPQSFLYRGAGQTERRAAGEVVLGTGPICVLSCVNPPEVEVADTTFGHTVLGVSSRVSATTGADHYTRDPAGGLLGQRTTNDGTHYFIGDGLGSIVAVTAAAGTAVATYAYDPYGHTTAATGDADITPWRYTGAYLDPTGLYKMGARYYDSATAHWTQQDPIHHPLDPKLWNRYAYIGGDPINYLDPSGFDACPATREGYFGFFDRAFDFVSDLAFTGSGVLGLIGFGAVVLTTANPVTFGLAVAGLVASSFVTGYGAYRSVRSYAELVTC